MKYLFTLQDGTKVHAEDLNLVNKEFGLDTMFLDTNDGKCVICTIENEEDLVGYDKRLSVAYTEESNGKMLVDSVELLFRKIGTRIWEHVDLNKENVLEA